MRLEWVKVVGIKHSSLCYWDVSRSILCWTNIKHVRERMCTSSLSLCMHSCLSLLAQVTRPCFVPGASRIDNSKCYILNCPYQGATEGLAAALWRQSLIPSCPGLSAGKGHNWINKRDKMGNVSALSQLRQWEGRRSEVWICQTAIIFAPRKKSGNLSPPYLRECFLDSLINTSTLEQDPKDPANTL